MEDYHTFSCFIIGEGNLPIQCANILLEYGHTIFGIISPDSSLQQWARKKEIPHYSLTDDLLAMLRQQSFHYLFSIVNQHVIPPEILSEPSRYAINYHDALLPQYAGVHATSWAIMKQEHTHGITWHVMEKRVDAGDILKQHSVEISPDDTALTLNVKCYEAAVHAFTELVDDLARNQVTPIQQNLSERTYFSLYKRPPAGCVLSLDWEAERIDAFTRALTCGPYPNPLGLPKFAIGQDFFIAPTINLLESTSKAPPGTITDIDESTISIATASNDMAIETLLTMDGHTLSVRDFVEQHDLHIGDQLSKLEPDLADRLTGLNAKMCKYESFWVERLTTPQPIELPYVNPATASDISHEPIVFALQIPGEVNTFLRNQAYIPCDFLLSALLAYLARLGHVNRFDIGFQSLSMAHKLSDLQGFFAAYVPLRVNIDPSQSFDLVHQTIQSQINVSIKHESYARDLVARYPQLQHPPSFSVTVAQVEDIADYHAPLDCGLNVVISQRDHACHWVYNSHMLNTEDVTRMAKQFMTFLQSIIRHPEQALWQLQLLTKSEQHQLLVEWNDTRVEYPGNLCVHELFEAQAERTPDAVAVVFEERQLTYRELNNRANQLAHSLKTHGVRPEVLVGICVERSLELIIGLLGILKAGGAYVPLDPSYPKNRLAFMMEDSQTPVLLTQQKFLRDLPDHAARVLCLDADWNTIAREPEDNPASGVTADNLIYVIYTSGSTGKPKGAMNIHRALCNRLLWMQDAYQLTGEDRILQKTPMSFDVSGWEFFWPLLAGARLVMAKPEGQKDSAYLVKLIVDRGITTMHFVPPMLQVFLEEPGVERCRSLRRVICSGEALPFELQERFFEKLGAELHNLYGPTEAAIDVTFWQCHPKSERRLVPIGRPIANTHIYILSPNLQPVPIGVPGELHIGGVNLARGYLNRPELTREKFIPNPFCDDSEGCSESSQTTRLYKTGDLARFLPDGNIEYLGRIDHQVKIRGFRIELGEIESVLTEHPAVREAVLWVREDHPGDKRLTAYIVQNPESNSPHLVPDLRNFLKEKLPDYMVPAAFVVLDAFPLTPNGKVDRKALPAPEQSRPELEEAFVAPRTSVEESLAGIWTEILGVEQVGVHDNFFDLGGNSLLSVQLLARVGQTFQNELSVITLFQFPTIGSLATFLSQNQSARPSYQGVHDRARRRKAALSRHMKKAI